MSGKVKAAIITLWALIAGGISLGISAFWGLAWQIGWMPIAVASGIFVGWKLSDPRRQVRE